jgi:hypothetical protein
MNQQNSKTKSWKDRTMKVFQNTPTGQEAINSFPMILSTHDSVFLASRVPCKLYSEA